MKNKKPHSIQTQLIILLGSLSFLTSVAVRADTELELLQAAEHIELESQQIVKDYFYLHQKIRVVHAQQQLTDSLTGLDKNIAFLEKQETDPTLAVMVEFLILTRDQMRETLDLPYSEQNGALMLDYGETLLEGAEYMAKSHIKGDSGDELLLVSIDRMQFNLERASKYYIAFRAGFTDQNNIEQVQLTVAEFEKHLDSVRQFSSNYPPELQAEVKHILKLWPLARTFYLDIEKNELPTVVFVSTQNLEDSLHKLELFHEERLQ